MDELDPVDRMLLVNSYVRRVQFESKIFLAALSEALGGKTGQPGRVPPDVMMAMLEGAL